MYHPMRSDDGKITKMEYEIFEEPYTLTEAANHKDEKPYKDKPCTANPSAVKPYPKEPSEKNPGRKTQRSIGSYYTTRVNHNLSG